MSQVADQHKYGQLDNIPRVNVLGVGVTPVNLPQAVQILEKWRVEGRREYVCCARFMGWWKRKRIQKSEVLSTGLA